MQHRYGFHQQVNVTFEGDDETVEMEVLAIIPDKCQTHGALMYGCEHGGTHYTTCEAIMQPLTATRKRKLN